MSKFFNIVYYVVLTTFLLFVFYSGIAVFSAPRQDALKRGFIPCTEQLVMDLYACGKGNMTCSLKGLWNDTVCNSKVMFSGFAMWINQEQPRPWSNFIFEPVAETNASVGTDDFYVPSKQNNAVDPKEDNLNMSEFIKQKQKELEDAKHADKLLNNNEKAEENNLEIKNNEGESEDAK